MIRLFVAVLLALFLGPAPGGGLALANEVKIGVLAIRGPDDALKNWRQVSDYLTSRIPGEQFVVVPLDYRTMEQAVARRELAFVVVNPAQYIDLAAKFRISRIATKLNHLGTIETASFGATFFTRANRTDIATLADLKGKSLAAASETAFASWIVARDELKRQGVTRDQLRSVIFTGIPIDSVVMVVQSGAADAGSVRTGVLEQMALEGKIALKDFRIINGRQVEGFPLLLSSDLYPEFAFARLKDTNIELANKVAAYLLLMPHVPTDRYPNPIGWAVPDNYEKVRNLLKQWRLPPYRDYGKVALRDALRQHWLTILLAFALSIATLSVAFLGLSIKQRRKKYAILQEAKQKLDLVHAMIVATPDVICIKDKLGRYAFVNPEAARIIARPVEEIIGRDAADFFPQENAQTMQDQDRQVLQDAATLNYEQQFTLQGVPRHMLVTKGPIYGLDGRVDGLFLIARDIHDFKQSQLEIAEKVEQLEKALATVKQLEGIIPICSYCKKIRDSKESWHQLELYISRHSEAEFSHGICPECMEVQLKEIDEFFDKDDR